MARRRKRKRELFAVGDSFEKFPKVIKIGNRVLGTRLFMPFFDLSFFLSSNLKKYLS
jgi:hypothetical protein